MFQLRIPTEADIPSLVELAHQEAREVGRPATTTEKEILDEWRMPGQEPAASCRVVEVDGEIVASANLWFEHPTAWAGAYVTPSRRGQGIGSALRDWFREALEVPHELTHLQTGYASTNPQAQAFVSKLPGFQHERSFLRMINASPDSIEEPSGPAIRYEPVDLVAETLRLRNESFQDHWDYHPWTAQSVEHRLAARDNAADLWFFAAVDGEPAGLCINTITTDTDGIRHGHLGPIGTLREHRGRGVARWLLRLSVRSLVAEGVEDVSLWVDTINPFQATKLYRDNGFEPHYEWRVYRRRLPLGDR